MASSKATPVIVIVPGAWCVPAHWQTFTKRLRNAGSDVEVVELKSVGAPTDPGNAMHADAKVVADFLRKTLADGRDAVVVMHSYGGIPGSEAVGMLCQEAPDAAKRIRQLVYVQAMTAEQGQAPYAFVASTGHPQVKVEDDITHYLDSRKDFFPDLPTEEADEAIALLQPMALSAFTQPTETAGGRDHGIPCTYIRSTQDANAPPGFVEILIGRLKAPEMEVTTRDVEAGHFPMLSKPDELVKLVQEAAGSGGK